MRKITRVEVLDGYRLDLTFDDLRRGVVDLSDLAGKGVFAGWADYGVFKSARIGPAGELTWGEHLDLCPDSLYLRVTGQRPEDVFSALKREHARA